MKIAIFVSGGGTNLQAILDACAAGRLPGVETVLVLASKKECFALERAKAANIPSVVLRRRDCSSDEAYDRALLAAVEPYRPDYIVLAGFLSKLGKVFLNAYRDHVLNIHPSLLPRYGGPGMYGIKPHEAVLASGDSVTGATVHLVNEFYDQGRILMQREVAVRPDDTAPQLQQRVMHEAEWIIYPEVLRRLAAGESL